MLNQSKKQRVIARLYEMCRERGDLTFSNDEVKVVSSEIGFGNPFDATKIDNSAVLPQTLRDEDMFVVHLGRGRHRFVPGIANGYHGFEPVAPERCYQWR